MLHAHSARLLMPMSLRPDSSQKQAPSPPTMVGIPIRLYTPAVQHTLAFFEHGLAFLFFDSSI
jgi:hypothetical protein